MPVINGVYLKDFAALPGSVADANIIPIAITGDQVAYRTTVAGIITDARITGKLLTGLSVTGTAILATDTILEAFGKVQNQINNRVSSVGLTMPSAFSVANSPITTSGTLAVTAAGVASQYIRGDGVLATLPSGGGGGASVNYYLNGSVAASVGTYYQMSKTAVIGGGTDFPLVGNGLIAQFLTDVADPNRLLIPAGAWNFEMYFQVSSAGGNGKFYVELLKYDGVNFTSIADSSAVPEEITGGTTIDLYLTSIAVPETVLLSTDRLAVRVYIVDSTGGRTVTLHTEDNTLCQVTTTFAGGISALNGLTANTQYFATGTTGTDFAIVSSSDTHTFNLPNASATARGVITTGTQTIAGAKTFTGALSGTSAIFSSTVEGYGSLIVRSADGGGKILKFLGGVTNYNGIVAVQENYGNTLEITASSAAGTTTFNRNIARFNLLDLSTTLSGALSGTSATFSSSVTALSLIKSGGTSAQFLKADGSVDATAYGTGSVTSVAALTLGTTGTDLSSSVANGTTTPVITLNVPTASALNRGALSSANWTTFNNKQNAISLTTTGSSGASTFISDVLNVPNYTLSGLGGVPTSRQLTINGTAYDLSADRTWSVGTVTSVGGTAGTGISISGSPITGSGSLTITNTAPDQTVVLTAGTGISTSGTYPNFTITNTSPSSGGTVTSVAALTLGTSGTDLSSSVANSTTTPVITLNVPTASALNRGVLSSADWTTFNNKQGTITLTTTGTSGAATFIANTLNIPNYADGGVLSVGAIGASPNANGATISGTVLNLEPASASFGGVITTGTQTIAGAKTLTGALSGTSATFSSGLKITGFAIPTGVGPEIVYTSGLGIFQTYDRTLSAYLPTILSGSTLDLRIGAGSAISVDASRNTTLGGTLSGTSATFSGNINAAKIYINSPSDVSAALQLKMVANTINQGIFLQDSTTASAIKLWAEVGKGHLDVTSTGTEPLYINAGGGMVGIGTTTDAGYKLDVNGTGNIYTRLKTTGSANWSTLLLENGDGTWHITNDDTGTFNIGTGADPSTSHKFTITSTGVATFSGTLGINGTADNVNSGTYTPTLTNVTNVTSSTAIISHYNRIGNEVTVQGSVSITPTAVDLTGTELGISLPISSAFTVSTNLSGTTSSVDYTEARFITLNADATNDRAKLYFSAETNSPLTFYFSFMYTVI